MIRKPWFFWLSAIVVGCGADFLFWRHSPGINFFIWILLILTGMILTASGEGKKPAPWNMVWIIAAITCAAGTFLRREPMTVALGAMLALSALAILAVSYWQGFWIYYTLRDAILAALRLLGSLLAGAVLLISAGQHLSVEETTHKNGFWRIAAPIFRGLAIALPILLVLALLLASADPIFSDRMAMLLRFLDLSRLGEYLFRLFYILVLAYLLTGLFLHASHPQHDETKPEPVQGSVKPFLGWVETTVILGSVILLFGSFVVLQFTYFFGAQANITVEGYTYSQYAVRGFNELVAVALLSLGLYLGLAAFTRLETITKKRIFSILVTVLFVEVMVILVSSFLRLGLYEAAYGFTRLRTYTHFFIFWLGGILAIACLLEILQIRRWLLQVAVLACFGFGLTLAVINVDGFIAHNNLARAMQDDKLDSEYLSTLSSDAIPAMAEAFLADNLDTESQANLGAALACDAYALTQNQDVSWQAYSFADSRARQILTGLSNRLDAWPVQDENGLSTVLVNGERRYCNGTSLMD